MSAEITFALQGSLQLFDLPHCGADGMQACSSAVRRQDTKAPSGTATAALTTKHSYVDNCCAHRL